jgi:hypothetical protein
LHRVFPLYVLIVYSLKLSFIANGNNLTIVGLTPGETIRFGSLEFTIDCLGHQSLSSEESDSVAIFVGMVHNGPLSLHTTLKDSSSEGGATSCAGGSSKSPGHRGCNVVTLTVPITTTLVLQTTPTVMVWTVAQQPGMELLLDQQQSYEEE